MTCPYKKNCPIFARFRHESTKNIFILRYCNGPKVNDCSRKILRETGKNVPENLLPNGKLL